MTSTRTGTFTVGTVVQNFKLFPPNKLIQFLNGGGLFTISPDDMEKLTTADDTEKSIVGTPLGDGTAVTMTGIWKVNPSGGRRRRKTLRRKGRRRTKRFTF